MRFISFIFFTLITLCFTTVKIGREGSFFVVNPRDKMYKIFGRKNLRLSDLISTRTEEEKLPKKHILLVSTTPNYNDTVNEVRQRREKYTTKFTRPRRELLPNSYSLYHHKKPEDLFIIDSQTTPDMPLVIHHQTTRDALMMYPQTNTEDTLIGYLQRTTDNPFIAYNYRSTTNEPISEQLQNEDTTEFPWLNDRMTSSKLPRMMYNHKTIKKSKRITRQTSGEPMVPEGLWDKSNIDDVRMAKNLSKFLKSAIQRTHILRQENMEEPEDDKKSSNKQSYRLDPILNIFRRQASQKGSLDDLVHLGLNEVKFSGQSLGLQLQEMFSRKHDTHNYGAIQILLGKARLDKNAHTYFKRLNDMFGVNMFDKNNEDLSNRGEVVGYARQAFVEGVPKNHQNFYSTGNESSKSDELASSKLTDSLLRIKAAKKRLLRIQERLYGIPHRPKAYNPAVNPGFGRNPRTEFERNQSLALKKQYRLDPVLNSSSKRRIIFRRDNSDDGSDSSGSSSREMKDWKEEFQELWMHKKYEAINKSIPQGDTVNMVAARPWGVHCGDPNQHDMPWGSCMLAAECEPEYRVYRGDFFCGRTTFVCCALQLTTYDNYQGFDISLDEESMATSSNEKESQKMNSREKRQKKDERDKKARQRERVARQKRLVKRKQAILKEIRKILASASKNRTKERKKKNQQLKKFMDNLKKQFKKDKKSVGDLLELEMSKIDSKLLNKLTEIKMMNSNFMTNSTFRNMILNGTITKQGARMLLEAYPELETYLVKRRSDDVIVDINNNHEKELEYDLEYGYIYE